MRIGITALVAVGRETSRLELGVPFEQPARTFDYLARRCITGDTT